MKDINNNSIEDYETERHNTVLKKINLAKSVKELPRINFSGLTSFLVNNAYFEKKRLKKSDFKPFVECLMDNGMLPTKEVTNCFLEILKSNYPNHSINDYMEIYKKLFSSGIINNMLMEMDERAKKIKNIAVSRELEKHNTVLRNISNTSSIEELEKIKITNLSDLIKSVTRNEIVNSIPKKKLKQLEFLIYHQADKEVVAEEIKNICNSYNLNCQEFNIMYEKMIEILDNKKVQYTVEELREAEEQTKSIYYQEHLDVILKITGALELNQLPSNIDDSLLTRYLSLNSKTQYNDIIPPYELITLTKVLLLTMDINGDSVKEELRNVVERRFCRHNKIERDCIFNSLLERYNSLYRLEYILKEVALYNQRVNEFTNGSFLELKTYGYRTTNCPENGGIHYTLINNAIDNLHFNNIKHTDYDSNDLVECMRPYAPNIRKIGGIILERQNHTLIDNLSNNGKFYSDNLSIEELEDLKMQLIKEKEEQIKEVEQEINKRKSIELKGKKNEQ